MDYKKLLIEKIENLCLSECGYIDQKSLYECKKLIDLLIDDYKRAFHLAINSTKGVVPFGAEHLYDQEFYY